MSSNGALDPAARSKARRYRPPSIVLRMTLWYAVSGFVLVGVATGLLYWVLADALYREDVRDLADNLNNAQLLLHSAVPGKLTAAPEQRPSWAPRHQPEIYLRVLDGDGRIVTETPGMGGELVPPRKAELGAVGTSGAERRDIVSPSGKPFLSLIVRVQSAGEDQPPQFIQVAMDREHDEYLLARYRRLFWIVLGVSLGFSSLIGYLIARSGMRPIENIGRTAARIRATTLHERIKSEGLPTELRELAEAFNGMLDRLQESFHYVSQFSDDVAHELRTPINNLRGEIEVALTKSRSGEEYRGVLESCLEECARLARLIRTLLFLARSDTSGEALQREKIDVGEELRKVETYYEPAAAEAGINLDVSAAEGLYGELDRTLFRQAIGNLVSNAIAHTPAGGHVRLAAGIDHRRLKVSVSDTGCGIAPEHLPRVLERFYRIDRSRTGSAQNVGLGLAVVKSIVARHGGQIEIESEVGRGTEIRLIFDRAA